MKKASNVRLSLRKLFIAMIAVGPIAVLPSSLLAAVPPTAPFTATSGTATWTAAGSGATIQSTDKAVLVWNDDAFNIATGETFNFSFTVPSNGVVLNKVGYLTTGALAVADDAIIDGTLSSTGRVFVLANGNITVGGGANVITIGGLFLSTLQEANDLTFTTDGKLALTGAATGNITIGNATNSPTIFGGLEAVGGAIISHRANVSGDYILRSVTAASGIDIAQSGAVSISGNFGVTTNNGPITGTNGVTVGSAAGNQTTTLSTGASGNSPITLGNAANDFEIVSITAPGTNGDVTLADANIITLGTSAIGGDLTVSATGTLNTNSIATNGALTIGGAAAFTTTTGNSNVNIGNNSTIVGALTATTTNSSVTVNTAGPLTAAAIKVGTGNRAGINLTAQTGVLAISGALDAIGSGTASQNINLTGGSINQTGAISLTAATGSVVAYNATAGGITIGGAVTAPRVTANSATAGGAIGQSAVITTTNATATSTFNAGTGTITLNGMNAFAANQVIQLTGSTVALTNTAATTIGTTNTTGSLTLNTGANALKLGTGVGVGTGGQNITVGGVLNATTTGASITDGDYSRFNVFGGVNLNSGGSDVILDAATAIGSLAPSVQLGRIDINAGVGNVTVSESTTLNLGTITGANLTAASTGGGIVDSGVTTLGGGGIATFTVPAAQAVLIDSPGHNLPIVNVIGGNDNSILVGATSSLGNMTAVNGNLTFASTAGVPIALGSAGTGAASVVGNLIVNSGGTINLTGNTSVTGNLSLTAADTGASSISDAGGGKLLVTGVSTVMSLGSVDLTAGANDFNSVVLNGIAGITEIYDINNLSVSGNAGASAVDVRAGSSPGAIVAPWALTLGNLNVNSLDARAGTGGGTTLSGTVTQLSGTSIHVENMANFQTVDANIIVGNNGNSFGRVQATVVTPTASRTVTIVEDSTLKLGTISSRGNTTITSRFGSILEDTTAAVTTTNNGTLTLRAVNGSVLIGNTTHTAGVTTGNLTAVVIDAPNGTAAVITDNQLALGAINANSLIVTATNNITQTAAAKVFGAASFNSTSGNIVVGNVGNNFGRVSLTLGHAARNITVSEGGTLNLGTVSMPGASTGNFTATSAGGDIIDTGLGGVRPGGTIVAGVPNPGTGVVTLVASNGNIILDDPTTEFVTGGGVVFNAQNVTLSLLGQSTLWLGSANASSVANNLTVTSAIGSIANAGALNIAGSASFQTGIGNITVTQPANHFGTVRFLGNQVSISQVNDMNLVRGSAAIGPAQLTSTGSYMTVADGVGVVSFGNTVSLSAASSITLPDAVQAVGQMTVNAAGTKDLSALSISGDLGGLTPVNLGTGTFVPPLP
ncbi:MAG: beta strand repeat-containing protein [Opitutaceae bacterium]